MSTDLTRDYPAPDVPVPPRWDTGHPDDQAPYDGIDGIDGVLRSEQFDRAHARALPPDQRHVPLNSARRWKEQAARLADRADALRPCCRDGYRGCTPLGGSTVDWYVPAEIQGGGIAPLPSGARMVYADGILLVAMLDA